MLGVLYTVIFPDIHTLLQDTYIPCCTTHTYLVADVINKQPEVMVVVQFAHPTVVLLEDLR